MKNLIRIFLLLIIVGGAVSIHTSCSDENDCSLAGRPMMYCTIYTIDPDNPNIALKDTLDSLTITALGTDSIILNNEKNVHTLMLPLRYTSDSTVFIFRYDPKRKKDDVDTLYIVQQNTPYFQSINGMWIYDETKHYQCQIWQTRKTRPSSSVWQWTTGPNRFSSYTK